MIVDANLLLYAVNTDDPRGDTAAQWLQGVLTGAERVGLPWQSLHAFVRLSTNVRVFRVPLEPDEAAEQVQEWVAAPAAWVPAQGSRHAEIFAGLLQRHQARGPLVTDLALAALALEHGVGVWSADSDFARFPEVRWEDPLRAR